MTPERQDFDQAGLPIDAALTPPAVPVSRTDALAPPRMPEGVSTLRDALDDFARRVATLQRDLDELKAERR